LDSAPKPSAERPALLAGRQKGCVFSMDEKTLGTKLQLARRRAGLTQQELCQKAGLSYSTLAKIERGAIKSPSVFTVAAIAGATNTKFEDLLNLTLQQGVNTPAVTPKKRAKSGVSFVFFDINGVCVRFLHKAFTEIARKSGKSVDLVETLFWRYNDAVTIGQMTMEEFNEILGRELEIEQFDWVPYYMNNVEQMPGIDQLIAWAAEHYEVGLLSNIMPGFIDLLIERNIIPKADYKVIVDSSKIGALKPSPKIYEIAQQLAALEPAEILTIDDSRSNLVTADRLGWHVVWFDEIRPEESIERAKQALEF
jgi:FMN phosphatase YigB (HAD superfamily)/DNA-binding XRE family transcriptional regulator